MRKFKIYEIIVFFFKILNMPDQQNAYDKIIQSYAYGIDANSLTGYDYSNAQAANSGNYI